MRTVSPRAFFASTTVDDDAFRRLVRFVTGGLSARCADMKLRQNCARVTPGCRLAYLDMLTGTDFVDDIRGLDTRYLVIVGDKDPGLDAATMQATFLARHPNERLVTIPNGGHCPMQECPPYFATIVEAFLRDAAAWALRTRGGRRRRCWPPRRDDAAGDPTNGTQRAVHPVRPAVWPDGSRSARCCAPIAAA
ncbi:alpha/beta fold hydrolase [Burkholderia sp. S-53]|uniref:alpha/beta fold hydrolase n=1 Tax=Burkholderia sp. S-53 TaxID=2906514 RepID=UPI0021CE2100|nr:alpha/beta hydrolase [Burkholderia sp. S-53]UXU91190.1 alpha/beta hydrolase [Burkholderia sp. S-53]